MDDPVDPTVLCFSYPLWAIHNAQTFDSKGPLDSIVVGVASLGHPELEPEKYIALFTDEDMARRFVDKYNLPPCVTRSVDSRESLLSLFEAAKQQGYQHVGFDTEENQGRVFPIADFFAERDD